MDSSFKPYPINTVIGWNGAGRSMILSLASTGPSYPAHNFPRIPIEIDEVVDECSVAYDLGFRFFHYHARNPATGQQFSSIEHNRNVFSEIRRINPGALVGGATSRKGEVELQISQQVRRAMIRGKEHLSPQELARIELAIRASAVEALPDRITTFTPPEIKITSTVSESDFVETTKGYSDLTRRDWNRSDVMQLYYRLLRGRCRDLQVGEELELTTEAALPVIEQIADDDSLGLPRNVFVLFLFGYSARLRIDQRQFDRAIEWVERLERRAGIRAHITVGAAIAPHLAAEAERCRGQLLPAGEHDIREVFEWSADCERVESFRVGLEDVPVLWGHQTTNLELATYTRDLCSEYGVRVIVDPDEVRHVFGMREAYVDGNLCDLPVRGVQPVQARALHTEGANQEHLGYRTSEALSKSGL